MSLIERLKKYITNLETGSTSMMETANNDITVKDLRKIIEESQNDLSKKLEKILIMIDEFIVDEYENLSEDGAKSITDTKCEIIKLLNENRQGDISEKSVKQMKKSLDSLPTQKRVVLFKDDL